MLPFLRFADFPRPSAFRLALFCASVGTAVLSPWTLIAQPVNSLRVMTYNIYIGGAAFGPLSRTVGVIQAAQADVIGIQEVRGSAQAIANSLGFHYYGFDSDLAIISRYPITQVLEYRRQLEHSKRVTSPSFEAVAEPLYTRAIGRWKNYEALLAPAFEILAPFVREFGYSD